MKIQCQSCQAKYTIADEKVVGKVVKIRCKKCSATIVINGNEAQPQEDNADTNVFDYANQGASGEQWTVNVADGDQRTMTPGEIVAAFKDGSVNDETYCWKDGMADWLPLREIDQLYGAIKLGPGPSLEDAPQSLPNPGGGALFSAEPAAAASSPFSAGNGNGGALFGGGAEAAQAAPAAARRASARGAGQDLFGNVEKAGGEDDVMTSALSGSIAGGGGGAAAAAAGPEKMTGQRNENSVLFSLSALTSDAKSPEKSSSSSSSSGGGENRTTATSDGSGLIDIRALSANMGEGGGGEKKDTNARVDDIMNLSGGGAFGAALAAPILAPPPLASEDLAALAHGGAPPKQSKTLIFAILGAGAFIAVAIVLAVVLTRPAAPTADNTKGMGSADPMASAMAMNDPANTAGGSNTATPPPGATGHEPPPPAVGNADKPATVNPGAKAAPGKPGAAAPKTGGGDAPAAPAEPAAKPAAPSQPASFGDALAQAAGKPKDAPAAAAPAAGGAPFDRGAAAASLGAVNVQSCKKPDGPTGSGRVEVTFNPDGSAASANIIEGPFPGTPVGGCIAGKFRGARVPAFSGAPVHVKKSFTVN